MSNEITAPIVAKKLLELYAGDETRWTRGSYARNEKEAPVLTESPSAVCWCIVGAICKVYSESWERDAAYNALRKAIASREYISVFNDRHTFTEVTAKLQEIAEAK